MSSTKIFAFSRRSQTNDKIMKKFIYIPNFLAVVAGLLRGESFEGRLYIDQQTHVLTLKLWNRKAPKNTRYHKVSDTDFGSLWKSAKHLLWREKFPLSMGSGRILSAMEADKHQAKQAVVDEYIIDNA